MTAKPISILLFGSTGQVGREIDQASRNDTRIKLTRITREIADLFIPEQAAAIILKEKPDWIINTAAYTAVDNAESERELARRLNADAAEEIAIAAAETGARLIHLSTDYIFPGNETKLLNEDDFLDPVNYYGTSKLDGEIKVLNACAGAIVLRTSWVFSAHGQNFVKTMLRLAQTKCQMSVVNDQIGGPTSANSIAAACMNILCSENGSSGIFHFQGAPHCSWADFAKVIFEISGNNVAVHGIPTEEYPTPAKRPLITTLDCSAIKREFGIAQPDWGHDLAKVIDDLNQETNDKG